MNARITYIETLATQRELIERAQEQGRCILSDLKGHGFAEWPEDGAQDCLDKLDKIQKVLDFLDWQEEEFISLLEELGVVETDRLTGTAKGSLRKISIQVTQGMINQSLLTLTQAKKAGVVSEGEQFIIRLPDDREFEAVLVQPGNRLSERGAIKYFYNHWNIRDGDGVLLKETAPKQWVLKKYDLSEDKEKLGFLAFLRKNLEIKKAD